MSRHEGALKILSKGIFIPVTPLALKEDRNMDEEAQKVPIRCYLDARVGGTTTAARSIQFAIRNPEHRFPGRILQLVSGEIGRFEGKYKKTIVRINGVCDKTNQAVGEAALIKRMGYNAVLLSPDGLGYLTEEELLERTKAVTETISVTGFYFRTVVGDRRPIYRYWESVCRIPNVIAVKCAFFNQYSTVDVMRAVAFSGREGRIVPYAGNDDNLFVDLLTPYRFIVDGIERNIGFRGGLLRHWYVWTEKAIELFEKVKYIQGQNCIPTDSLAQAVELADISGAFFGAVHEFGGRIPGPHEILRKQEIFKNTLYLDPKETMSQGQIEEIDRIYRICPR